MPIIVTAAFRQKKLHEETTATPEPTSIPNSHFKICANRHRPFGDKGHGSRQSKGYENFETESGSTGFVLFDD